jgi:hypothetical protein
VATRRLVCNPADDHLFVSTAKSLARGGTTLRVFEASLRAPYPAAVVHDGTLNADGAERWYVYRDGQWAGARSHLAEVEV